MWADVLWVLWWLVPIAILDVALCVAHRRWRPYAYAYSTNAHEAGSVWPAYFPCAGFAFTTVRWFQLHCACNWLVVAAAGPEFWSTLTAAYPWEYAQGPSSNTHALYFATALHVYHTLWWTLKPVDVLHHATSAFLCAPLMLCLNTRLLAWHLVIGTGLPGGIDYALLTMVKYEVLDAVFEKRVNAWLNSYVRAPFGATGSFLTVGVARQAFRDGAPAKGVAGLVVACVTFWNVTYFAKRAVESYAAYRAIHRDELHGR